MKIKDILSKASRSNVLEFKRATATREHLLRGREKRLKWVSKSEQARVLNFQKRVEDAKARYATQAGHTREGKVIMPVPHVPPRLPDLDLRTGRGA